MPNYTWYKDIDLNTTIGNDSVYRISNVTIKNSGNYICIVETVINGTEEKFNQTVTIDIRNIGEWYNNKLLWINALYIRMVIF